MKIMYHGYPASGSCGWCIKELVKMKLKKKEVESKRCKDGVEDDIEQKWKLNWWRR